MLTVLQKLLMDLALGRVKESPFPNEAVSELKNEIVKVLSSRGLQLRREMGDRNELPIYSSGARRIQTINWEHLLKE